MKQTIIGIEISEGMSKKSGKAYAMGTVHTVTQLAPPWGEGNVAKGASGDRYECDVGLLRKIEHLSFPLTVELEKQEVMKFGKRETIITDIKPLAVVKA